MNVPELRKTLPPILRFRDAEQKLNLPRWIVRRFIADGVRTMKLPGRRSVVMIDRDSLLDAIEATAGTRYQPVVKPLKT